MEEAKGEPLTCYKAKALLNLSIGYFDLYVLELLFSETAKLFESKLGWNFPWVALYKIYLFCGNWKSKTATITGKEFDRGPNGKNV